MTSKKSFYIEGSAMENPLGKLGNYIKGLQKPLKTEFQKRSEEARAKGYPKETEEQRVARLARIKAAHEEFSRRVKARRGGMSDQMCLRCGGFIELDKDAPGNVRDLVNAFGSYQIRRLRVVRTPVQTKLFDVANFLTQGAIKKKMQLLHIDKYFHLWLEFDLEFNEEFWKDEVIEGGPVEEEKPKQGRKNKEDMQVGRPIPKYEDNVEVEAEEDGEDENIEGGIAILQKIKKLFQKREKPPPNLRSVIVRIQKNERVDINYNPAPKKYEEGRVVSLGRRKLTMAEFIDNAEEFATKNNLNLYEYDSARANCQHFVKWNLQANGLWNAKLEQFVMQDVENVLPGFIKKMFKGLTNFAARLNILFKGRGFEGEYEY